MTTQKSTMFRFSGIQVNPGWLEACQPTISSLIAEKDWLILGQKPSQGLILQAASPSVRPFPVTNPIGARKAKFIMTAMSNI